MSVGRQHPRDDTATRVGAVVQDIFGVPAERLSAGMELQEGLQLDSLSVVELQVALEDALGVRLDPDDGPMVTLGDLISAIDRARRRPAGQ